MQQDGGRLAAGAAQVVVDVIVVGIAEHDGVVEKLAVLTV